MIFSSLIRACSNMLFVRLLTPVFACGSAFAYRSIGLIMVVINRTRSATLLTPLLSTHSTPHSLSLYPLCSLLYSLLYSSPLLYPLYSLLLLYSLYSHSTHSTLYSLYSLTSATTETTEMCAVHLVVCGDRMMRMCMLRMRMRGNKINKT
jgi:hypothetical protein